MHDDRLTALYQSLDFDRPLDYGDPKDRALYVAGMHDGESNPVDELRIAIEMADSPGSWLFTGHRGVGKSTELRRLAAQLPKDRFVVGVADVTEYLNLNEAISIEKLLLMLVAALADMADQKLGGDRLAQTYLKRFWSFLKDTQIEPADFADKFPADMVTAKMTLKQIPNLQERVIKATSGATAVLAEQVKKFAQQVVADVRQQQGAQMQVVLILDSLERLRVTGADAQVCYDGISQTFDIHAEFLKLTHLHVLYSVPPYLPFLMPQIGSYFGVEICSLPHVKVFETPAKMAGIVPVKPCASGLAMMVQSVENRFPSVTELIPRPMLAQLALASSGSVRNFFRLIRSAITKAQARRVALPLPDDRIITLAQQILRNEMPLAEEDKVWLKKVRETHGTGLDKIANLSQLARLFDNGVILNYRNGEDWCEVHYLLHDQLP